MERSSNRSANRVKGRKERNLYLSALIRLIDSEIPTMKCIFLLLSSILVLPAFSQQYRKPKEEKPRPNSIGFSLHIPIGNFNSTHTIGFGLDYTWSTRSFKKDSVSDKLIHLAANAGASYYGGKRITTAGNEFTYDRYANFYLMAGIDCKWTAPLVINLVTGPVMSLYKGDTDLGFGVNLFSNYSISPRVAAGPGIQYRKFAETDALWAGIFRISYNF